ncbi:Uncharacterized protein FWK35_00017443, partial [Aphis craccivora]
FVCCFFLVSVYSITRRNYASISNFWGGFRLQSECSLCIIESKVNIFHQFSKESRKTKKKVTENMNFYTKPVFGQIDFFLYGYNSKTNQFKYLIFSTNVTLVLSLYSTIFKIF